MRIRGLVSSVRELPAREGAEPGRGPTTIISVEGLSMMPGRNCGALPQAGKEIEAVVTCLWRKDKKGPLHFMESWEPAV